MPDANAVIAPPSLFDDAQVQGLESLCHSLLQPAASMTTLVHSAWQMIAEIRGGRLREKHQQATIAQLQEAISQHQQTIGEHQSMTAQQGSSLAELFSKLSATEEAMQAARDTANRLYAENQHLREELKARPAQPVPVQAPVPMPAAIESHAAAPMEMSDVLASMGTPAVEPSAQPAEAPVETTHTEAKPTE